MRRALGNRIRELRKERGWSQEQFSAYAHVHRTFAGALERGEKNLSFQALAMIARCFGLTLSELLEGLESGGRPKTKPSRDARSADVEQRILNEVLVLERAAQTIKDALLAPTPPRKSAARPERMTVSE